LKSFGGLLDCLELPERLNVELLPPSGCISLLGRVWQITAEYAEIAEKNLENSASLAASAVNFSRMKNICPQTEMLPGEDYFLTTFSLCSKMKTIESKNK
jgi:hypothetical protein